MSYYYLNSNKHTFRLFKKWNTLSNLYLVVPIYYVKSHTYMKIVDLSTESINILGILELGSIFWMNLVRLEYLRPK